MKQYRYQKGVCCGCCGRRLTPGDSYTIRPGATIAICLECDRDRIIDGQIEEAKKRQGQRTDLKPNIVPKLEQSRSVVKAGKVVGVSKSYVSDAKKLKEETR